MNASSVGRSTPPVAPVPGSRPVGRAVWAAVMLSPLLGWITPVSLLIAALWWVTQAGGRTGIRSVATLAAESPTRVFILTVSLWWLILLGADVAAPSPTPWWRDLRCLAVILPTVVLIPFFREAAVSHAQIGRWALATVWVCVLVIAVEYVAVVHVAGIVHHRPRALAGNALFLSAMLVTMMMLGWLAVPQSPGSRWLLPLVTHVAGLACLAGLLGARAFTLIAALLLPLPLVFFGHRLGKGHALRLMLIAAAAVCGLLAIASHLLSGWYLERWQALWGAATGADPSALTDYGIATRALHWPAAWQAFLERPWLGHGSLNEPAVLARQLPAGTPVLPTAHQQYLSFLLWSGLPGLLAGTLLLLLPVLLALGRRRGRSGLFAATALCLPMMLNGLTDTVFDDLRILSFHLTMTAVLDALVEPDAHS